MGFLQNAVPLRNFYAQRYDLKNKAKNQAAKPIKKLVKLTKKQNKHPLNTSLCGYLNFNNKNKRNNKNT
ncbi:hypothetical protein DB891_11420 [Flavobacterium laiguense]|uniref:Uncharacterized protein n=1 Tax=Flavobacterium laiguense TaxID=2169409 RepID=A0A2U1JTT6_9FLAO|nr:hypothetical protein DB891_11420 [Flavobacterium laiguense]